jgi:hypothetical protein
MAESRASGARGVGWLDRGHVGSGHAKSGVSTGGARAPSRAGACGSVGTHLARSVGG